MNIFNETKARLPFLGLGTSQFVRIAGLNIPRLVIRLFIIMNPILFYSLEVALYIKLKDNLNDRFSTISMIVACFPITPIYISLVLKTNEIDELFSYMENVINTRMATESFATYEASNTNINKIVQKVFSTAYKILIGTMIPPALCPLFFIAFGFPSPDYWFTTYAIEKLSTFLGENPLGFIVVVTINLFVGLVYMGTNEAFATIYVMISTNIESIVVDISLTVDRLNEKVSQKMPIKEDMKSILQLHLHSYKILAMLEDIIRAPIVYQISVFAIETGLFLYVIEMNVGTFSVIAGMFIGGLSLILMQNYTLCYFTTTSTLNAMSISDRIYNLHWYQLPHREQNFVQLMIQRAQKPFELKGLGVFVCSLETFLKMLQTAVSYYMIFRKL